MTATLSRPPWRGPEIRREPEAVGGQEADAIHWGAAADRTSHSRSIAAPSWRIGAHGMTAETEQSPRDPVADAARAAFAKASGDVAAATRLMEQVVRANRALRDELTEPLIAGACYGAVRTQCRAVRRQIWSPPRREIARTHADGARRILRHAETLLAFPLLGGRHLGEAQREEVAAAAEFYATQAGDMATKARWLQLIAQSLPKGRKVADVLTEERLRELREAAMLAVELSEARAPP